MQKRLGQTKNDKYYISIDNYNYYIVEELMNEYLKEYNIRFKDIKHYLKYDIEHYEEPITIGDRNVKFGQSVYTLIIYFLHTEHRFKLFQKGCDLNEIGKIYGNLIDFLKGTEE